MFTSNNKGSVQNRLYLDKSMRLCRNDAQIPQGKGKVFLHVSDIGKVSDRTVKRNTIKEIHLTKED